MTSAALAALQTDYFSEELLAPGALPWFALRVKPNHENVTTAALRCKGYEEFAPTYRCRRRLSDRVKEIDLPLFPGYVFCRFDVSYRLRVLTTPGIVSIVGLGKIPQPIEEKEMARVQAIVRSGSLAYPWPFLQEGQKVVIMRGPLTGVEGFLVNVKNQDRLVVSITMLQRSVATEIDRDCVEPARTPFNGRKPPITERCYPQQNDINAHEGLQLYSSSVSRSAG